ncbi:hypothetical protein [Pseudomonas aeruginosa]|uniref:hypothetical protein n=1 Tax=Pseudomonas aeruginosa TaxID=287 RepID=UPI002E2D966A|nr:hypothetical protein [Pseudomonas aeruginosa]
MKWTALSACLVLVLCGCGAPDVTGTYVGRDDQSLDVLQLTQGSGGSVLGSITHRVLAESGVTKSEVSTIHGMADGSNISLEVANLGNLASTPLQGTITADGITIIRPGSAESQVQQLQRVDASGLAQAEKQFQMSALMQHEARRRFATVAELNQRIEALNRELDDYSARTKRQIAGVPEVLEHFRAAGRRADTMLKTANRLSAGTDQERYQAQAVAWQVLNGQSDVKALTDQVNQTVATMAWKAQQLADEAQRAQKLCGAGQETPSGVARPDMGPCRSLEIRANQFRADRDGAERAYRSLTSDIEAANRSLAPLWASANKLSQ